MPKDAERSQIIPPPRREATGEPEQGVPTLRGARKRRRGPGLFVTLALVTLAVIVVLAGLLMHFGSSGPLAKGEQATVPTGPSGPFVKPPYNAAQVNALTHLLCNMTSMELAKALFSHMSLDQNLCYSSMTP